MGNLSYRRKMTMMGGGAMALLFILVQFIYLPAYDKRTDLEQALSSEQNALNRIRLLQKEYRSLASDHSDARGMIQNRNKGFTLFSFLDRKASKSGVKGNIDYMKPYTRELENSPFTLSIVKLKLKQIVLRDFTRFIREVEALDSGIWIAFLSLSKSGKEKKWLEATIEAHTLVAKGGTT